VPARQVDGEAALAQQVLGDGQGLDLAGSRGDGPELDDAERPGG